MDRFHDTGASKIELSSKLSGVQLPGLAIALIENVLIAATECCLLTRFHKLLNATILEDTIGKRKEASHNS